MCSDTEIDVSSIDWNKLSPEEFQKLNNQLVEEKKLAKKQERKKHRVSGTKVIRLNGETYEIKMTDYERYKKIRSQKTKELFRQKIMETYKPVRGL